MYSVIEFVDTCEDFQYIHNALNDDIRGLVDQFSRVGDIQNQKVMKLIFL